MDRYSTMQLAEKMTVSTLWRYITVMAAGITGNWTLCSTVPQVSKQRKDQSHASLAIVKGLTGGFPLPRANNAKVCPYDDVIVIYGEHTVFIMSQKYVAVGTGQFYPYPLRLLHMM